MERMQGKREEERRGRQRCEWTEEGREKYSEEMKRDIYRVVSMWVVKNDGERWKGKMKGKIGEVKRGRMGNGGREEGSKGRKEEICVRKRGMRNMKEKVRREEMREIKGMERQEGNKRVERKKVKSERGKNR